MQTNKLNTTENITAICATFGYAILIHDQLNALAQICILAMIGTYGKPEGCDKILKKLVLKEVWSIFTKKEKQITPVNDMQKNMTTINELNSYMVENERPSTINEHVEKKKN